MRVIAGSAGGLRLAAPEGNDTRPTGDRVREAVFNSLGSMGAIEDAQVVDLFAGSGALGIEALSRGAAHATFVERDPKARAIIDANLATTGLTQQATVVAADVVSFLTGRGTRFDLALVDPPYEFDEWSTVLDALDAELALLESNRVIDAPDGWSMIRDKRYGTTVITLVEPKEGP